jgi:hypothetical protein
VLGIPLYHDLLHENTCMSQVEVDIPLHNALVVGSYGILLDLFLHLCIQFDLLAVHCTKASDYTTRGYTMVVHYYTEATQCYSAALQCCMEVVLDLTWVQIFQSSFLPAPYRYPTFSPSSDPLFYILCHHDSLFCKSFNMNSWVLFDTFASLDNDMDHSHVFYRSCTRVLLLARDFSFLLPCTTRTLGIRSCGVFLSCMWYIKQILSCPCPYSDLVEMLDSSDTPSIPLWLDLYYDIGFPLVVRMHVDPLLESKIFVV